MVQVLDPYYLAITALVTVGYQLAFFFVAAGLKIDTVTDFAGGTNFLVLALLTFFLSQAYTTRQIIATVFIGLWALRLSGFLFWRILKMGKDKRFDDRRDNFWAFLVFWIFQMIWVWVVSLPVTVLNAFPWETATPDLPFGTATDIIGIIFFVVGLVIEAVADQQKTAFRENAANKDKWCDAGLWYYSRHPNYAGEMLLWIGVLIFCSFVIQVNSGTWYIIFSPLLLIVFLMFVSGVPMLERPANKRYGHRADYQEYRRSTSILVLLPPAVYRPLPDVIKTVLLFEWPMYASDPEHTPINARATA